MGGLQRGEDPLQPRQLAEGAESLDVGDRLVARAARCRAAARARGRRLDSRAPPRSSGPRGSGPPRQRGSKTGRRAGPPCARRRATRRGSPSSPSPPASTPISSTSVSSMNGIEGPDRVRAAPDAGDHPGRERALRCERLLARLVADHPLEVANEGRVRRRADGGADDVVGRSRRWSPNRGSRRSPPPSGSGRLPRPGSLRRRAAASARRWAPAGACPRCPCRRRTRARAARTPWPPRRRAGRHRSRRSSAACPSGGRAAPARPRC